MMDTIFFALSKLIGIALKVEIWLLVLALVTFWASFRSKRRTAVGSSAVLFCAILGLGLFPIGDVLLKPLEERYAIQQDLTQVDGIVVLGGGEDVSASRRSGQPQINEGGDRYLAGITLANKFPQAKLLFAGGSGRLREMNGVKVSEASVAKQIFTETGLAPDRLHFEERSRNTAENARLSLALADPQESETWLLVTSAFHMPRAMNSFANAGWKDVVPFPVDFRTRNLSDGLGWHFQRNLALTNIAVREWVGRMIYAVTGR